MCLFLNITFQGSRKFMKGVLLGELIVDQETIGPVWGEIRYHMLMEPIMIHFTSLRCILLSSILILSFQRYYCAPGVIL